MFSLVFMMVCATVIRLRRRWPDRRRPFAVPLSPWLPAAAMAAGMVLSVWLLNVSRIAWVVALVWIVLGAAMFLIRRHGLPHG